MFEEREERLRPAFIRRRTYVYSFYVVCERKPDICNSIVKSKSLAITYLTSTHGLSSKHLRQEFVSYVMRVASCIFLFIFLEGKRWWDWTAGLGAFVPFVVNFLLPGVLTAWISIPSHLRPFQLSRKAATRRRARLVFIWVPLRIF